MQSADHLKNTEKINIIRKNGKELIDGVSVSNDAKIISIERDPSKKEEWWNIGLTFLTVPLQNVIWTLRTAQMTGQEIFTMGGEKRFFQTVVIGSEHSAAGESGKGRKTSSQKGSLKRIK